jgi:hypothetical protein
MVTSVARVHRPRIVSGLRPLAERFQDTVDYASRVIPEGDPERSCLTLSVSETNLDRINDAIVRSKERRYALVEPSPELRRGRKEVYDLMVTHDRLVGDLKSAQQRWLWRAKLDWKHKLLRSLRADMVDLPPLMIPNWDPDKYPDAPSARLAAREIFAKLQHVETLVAAINNAMQFDSTPPELQSEHLIHARWDDSVEYKTRLIAVEAQLAAALAEIDKLKRSPNSKSKGN